MNNDEQRHVKMIRGGKGKEQGGQFNEVGKGEDCPKRAKENKSLEDKEVELVREVGGEGWKL